MQIVLTLILSVILYLAFPFLYVKGYGKVCVKKGKKLALINSIVCELISVIIAIIIGLEPETNGTMFAQGFLYYFIAKKILIDDSITEEALEEKDSEQHKGFSDNQENKM